MAQKNRTVSNKSVRILAADTDETNLSVIGDALFSLGYQVILARDEIEMLARVKETPDLIILGCDPAEPDLPALVGTLKAAASTIPIILTRPECNREACLQAVGNGVDDFVALPPDRIELSTTISSLLVVSQAGQLSRYRDSLKTEINRQTRRQNEALARLSTPSLRRIYRLSNIAEFRDDEVHGHIERISHYSTAIARKLGQGEAFLQNILFASPLHDVGEIAVPDALLKKPGKLTEPEWEIMRRHSPFGAALLQKFEAEFLEMAQDIAATHHERWDGTGYPCGLKGTEIPLSGRIVAIADVFDVLTWERPYKQPVPLEEAFTIIRGGRGTHFDPDIVDAFFAIRDEITAEYKWWKFIE